MIFARAGALMRWGILLLVLLIIAGSLGAAWHVGWPQRQTGRALQALAGLLQKTGFAVQDIAVEGRQQTGKAEIFPC